MCALICIVKFLFVSWHMYMELSVSYFFHFVRVSCTQCCKWVIVTFSTVILRRGLWITVHDIWLMIKLMIWKSNEVRYNKFSTGQVKLGKWMYGYCGGWATGCHATFTGIDSRTEHFLWDPQIVVSWMCHIHNTHVCELDIGENPSVVCNVFIKKIKIHIAKHQYLNKWSCLRAQD